MPAYPGNALAKLLRDNSQGFFFNNEAAIAGTYSLAFQIERINRTAYPWGLSFEAWFSGAPGVFEIDILGANNDIGIPSPGNYVTLGSINSVNNANAGRWDMPSNMWPKYVLAYIKTLTNAVNVSVQATR